MGRHLHIVIVNYRTADLVVECLRSLAADPEARERAMVTVVDNDSQDGSQERLDQATAVPEWRGWATVVQSGRNGGFAFGNNVGIRLALEHADLEYVWLLNPDTIVRPGAARALLDAIERRPDVGIVGSRLENAHGQTESSAHTLPSPLGELEGSARLGALTRLLARHAVSYPPRDVAHECDWVSGASMLVRRRVFEQIGLLDEGFFLYFEEVDFCARARKAGWQVWHEPASRVVHLEGSATGIRERVRRRPRYWFESRRRFFLKHYGVLGLVAADVLWGVGYTSLGLRRALGLGAGGALQDPPDMAQDLLWGDLRALLHPGRRPATRSTTGLDATS